MSRILVTGGAGYIGSHCCKALAQAGYEPITYDSLERGHEDAVRWGPLEKGNVLDQEHVSKVIKKYRPEAVMHFAGYILVGESVENPEIYYRNNVEGSRTLINSMLENGINKLIFSSTCATYGNPLQIPLSEEHQQEPVNPYGETKLEIEKLIQEYAKSNNLNSISLRYFNAAGADPDADIGEDHNPETHLIPIALDTALGIYPYLTINGDDYDTPDGTCIRDYVHVMDVAQAHINALQCLKDNETGADFYNLGNSRGYSVLEVITTIEKITGNKIKTVYGSRRAGDSPILIGSSDKIRQELAWKPAYSSLESIIDSAWRWHLKKAK